jgi:hypothetical protein
MITCGNGTCPTGQVCGGGGTPNVCGTQPCVPTTCAAQGKNCGTISDGCGGTPSCGTCTLPQTCGATGTPNVCGCVPTTCAALGKNCGSISDGCGLTLTCGTCTSPETCGGSGVSNVCGCTPALEPTPKGTSAIYPKTGGKVVLAQTFSLDGRGSIQLDAVQLRGQYPSADAAETITLGIYPTGKGGIPDSANPVWEAKFVLGKTDFYPAVLTTKTTALHTFPVAVKAALTAGVDYWLVVGSTSTVILAGYDGTTLLGDAIASGSAYSNAAAAGWVIEKNTDLYVVINPCK